MFHVIYYFQVIRIYIKREAPISWPCKTMQLNPWKPFGWSIFHSKLSAGIFLGGKWNSGFSEWSGGYLCQSEHHSLFRADRSSQWWGLPNKIHYWWAAAHNYIHDFCALSSAFVRKSIFYHSISSCIKKGSSIVQLCRRILWWGKKPSSHP